MSKYFTSHILSAKCLEMAQYLYFVASHMELDVVKIINEDPNFNLADRFIKDFYDSKKILLKLMITKVGENNIQEVWKITDIR
ncbi:8726_t:CDS:2, partial [Racocetra persica]